jgi:hypothetical protein
MNLYISNTNSNQYFVPCSKIEITSVGSFFGADTGTRADNNTGRNVGINLYNSINVGEVINSGNLVWSFLNGLYQVTSGGSAIVVADETIFDPVSLTNKRILYVTNLKGTFTGTLKGMSSNTIASVVSVTSGNMTTNSLGSLHGVINIPALTINGGKHSIMFNDSTSADPLTASTLADAGYSSSGLIDTFTTHINYQTQSVTTVTNTTVVAPPPVYSGGYNGWI